MDEICQTQYIEKGYRLLWLEFESKYQEYTAIIVCKNPSGKINPYILLMSDSKDTDDFKRVSDIIELDFPQREEVGISDRIGDICKVIKLTKRQTADDICSFIRRHRQSGEFNNFNIAKIFNDGDNEECVWCYETRECYTCYNRLKCMTSDAGRDRTRWDRMKRYKDEKF